MPDLSRLIIALCLVFPAAVNSQSTDSVVPCTEERPFCGRLLVTITGAGERGNVHNKDGSVTGDPEENDTFRDYMQMRSQGDEGLLSQAIVISSDNQLKAKLDAVAKLDAANKAAALAKLAPATRAKPQETAQRNGLVGVDSASVDTFGEFLNNDLKMSHLARAIDNFERDPGCIALKRAHGTSSVLPFVMVQIHIITENAVGLNKPREASLPLWPTKGMVGSYDQWKGNDNRVAFDKDLADRVMQKLKGTTRVILVSACNAADFGSWFQEDDNCGCYLTATDHKQVDFAGRKAGTPWIYSVPDTGEAITTMRAKSEGAPNLARLGIGSFRKYANVDPIDVMLVEPWKHNNPLMGFIYSSVDARVEKILMSVPESNMLYASAKRFRRAGFVSELSVPSKQTVNGQDKTGDELISFSSHSGSSSAARELSQRRDAYKAEFKDVLSENIDVPDLSAVTKGLSSFMACIDRENAKPVERCNVIRTQLLARAAEGVRKDGFMASTEDHDLDATSTALTKATRDTGIETLVKRYEAKEIDIAQFFLSLRNVWTEFGNFRKVLLDVASRRYGHKLPPDIQAAVDHMDSTITSSYAESWRRLFPNLRQEIIKVRLAKLDAAVSLVTANVTSESEKDMIELNNELGAMVNYPIGSAFDVKYGKRMKEFLKEIQKQSTENR